MARPLTLTRLFSEIKLVLGQPTNLDPCNHHKSLCIFYWALLALPTREVDGQSMDHFANCRPAASRTWSAERAAHAFPEATLSSRSSPWASGVNESWTSSVASDKNSYS